MKYRARREVIEQMALRYREASRTQKSRMLDAVVGVTGYARKYAIQLFNQTVEQKPRMQRPRRSHYGPEVQRALILAWTAANQICTKRLIPFLPTLVEALERHGHLHLTQEYRDQLLEMSAATAERILHSQRTHHPRGLSTTRAGTLLKNQIPIRTFLDWNETQPGFLEADLVAHCGIQAEGGYVYTLTLTDIATGWTECLPLLYRSRETVLAAFRFPFWATIRITAGSSSMRKLLLIVNTNRSPSPEDRGGRDLFCDDPPVLHRAVYRQAWPCPRIAQRGCSE